MIFLTILLVLLAIIAYYLYNKKDELQAMANMAVKIGTEMGTEAAINKRVKNGEKEEEVIADIKERTKQE